MTTDRPAQPGDSAVSDDPEQLKQEIERTREQLGETVEALVAKVDVKARARERMDELSQRWKSMIAQLKDRAARARQQAAAWAAQARQQAAVRAGQARGQLASKTPGGRTAAVQTGGSARSQLQASATAVGGVVRDKTPEPVQRAAQQVAQRASAVSTQRRALDAVATAGVVLAGVIVIRRRRRR